MTFHLEEMLILARTIYGEAANDPYDTKKAIGHVVENRVASPAFNYNQYHNVAAACVAAPCWSLTSPLRNVVLNASLRDKMFRESLRAALAVQDEPDFVNGALRYMTKERFRHWPEGWGSKQEPVAAVGRFLFFGRMS